MMIAVTEHLARHNVTIARVSAASRVYYEKCKSKLEDREQGGGAASSPKRASCTLCASIVALVLA